jgi:hypothetical protein
MKVIINRTKIFLSFFYYFGLVNEENNSKEQLTGSLEDLNFFNLPVDIR